MALALYIPVSGGRGKITGRNMQHVIVQHIQYINTAQTAACMPCIGAYNVLQDLFPVLDRFLYEVFTCHRQWSMVNGQYVRRETSDVRQIPVSPLTSHVCFMPHAGTPANPGSFQMLPVKYRRFCWRSSPHGAQNRSCIHIA
jgi:hypothetical protein